MIILYMLVILTICIFLFRLYFRRDPERKIPEEKGLFIAPAEGKVDYIGPATDEFVKGMKRSEELLQDLDPQVEYTMISIFMRLWDVHVQRIPVSGKVLSVKHFPGRLLAVNTMQAGLLNEKTETLLETDSGLIKVVQIAGLIARRIDTYVTVGDECSQGDRLGMIHFGSRVTILVPSEAIKEITCSVGDKVYAGKTIIVTTKS